MSGSSIVPFYTGGRPVFVISDLHMAAGLNKHGNYEGTENFFADEPFVRFVNHLQQRVQGKGGWLVINGDFIDFLRIKNYPLKDDEQALRCWQEILGYVGIDKSTQELAGSVSNKEKKYGLKTDDYKSIWKLYTCMNGHKPLFECLAQWVHEGNELVVVKGNHDLEWQWPAVQNYFCIAMQRLMQKKTDKEVLLASLRSHIYFVQDALTFDGRVHIEHGHNREAVTAVDGDPTIHNGTELNLPFGSFLNRYLINGFELSYPYLDNVRPTQNILKVLFKENFPKALNVLAVQLPYTLSMVPGRHFKHILRYLIPTLLVIVVPLAATIISAFVIKKGGGFAADLSFWRIAGNVLKCGALLFLSYLIAQVLVQLVFTKEPSFSKQAKTFYTGEENKNIEAFILGHTHDPEQQNLAEELGGQKQKWYFNTGTWIPVFETSSAQVRFDRTYTFIAIDLTEDPPCRERLQRWNDDAERVDTMILNDKK